MKRKAYYGKVVFCCIAVQFLFLEAYLLLRHSLEVPRKSFETERPPRNRQTIADLLSKATSEQLFKNDTLQEGEGIFTYNAVNCTWSKLINGSSNTFYVCAKANIQHRALNFVEDALKMANRKAYFIGGERDEVFESNFLAETGKKIKINLVGQNTANFTQHDFISISSTNIFNYTLFNLPNTLRIKEIVDWNKDGDNIELFKYDLGADSLRYIFSVLVPLPVCQILVKVSTKHDHEVILKKMSDNLMYMFASNYDHFNYTYYWSFMHKFCLERYGTSDSFVKVWQTSVTMMKK